ncbi:MAG: hypothetical protein IJT97_08715 [Bacteroidaceae bacterium]|nr:hypothetical protein [Bacteroidaceae bacterium]
MKEEKDALTQRIAAGLGERKRKLDRMAEWERPARRIPMWTVGTLLAAACVVLVVLLVPGVGDNNPSVGIEAVRGAEVDVERLMEAGRYEEAFCIIDSALLETEKAVAELEQSEQDEETEYELCVERQRRDDLLRVKKKILEKMKKR